MLIFNCLFSFDEIYGFYFSKNEINQIEYDSFLRVVVSTANLLAIDYDQKTQGLWVQDFPKKVEEKDAKSVKHNRENKLAKGI